MRAFALHLAATLTLIDVTGVTVAEASERATVAVQANAQVGSRTSLSVSSETLRFVLTAPDQPAVMSIDFVAGVRTQAGAEVVLTVEAGSALAGPGGAADVETALTFSGEGDGTIAGSMSSSAPVVAGRWTGSGRRSGRVSFTLRAAAPGTYTMPVRFVLSAP